jgi:acyl carrier protein
MERDTILTTIHETAAEFAASNGREVSSERRSPDVNLLETYGFTSLDALEYLLILEEKFGITFEDEDLNEEVLSSALSLADYVMTHGA